MIASGGEIFLRYATLCIVTYVPTADLRQLHLLRKCAQLGSRKSTRKPRASRSIGNAAMQHFLGCFATGFLVSISGEIKCSLRERLISFLSYSKVPRFALTALSRLRCFAPDFLVSISGEIKCSLRERLISFRYATLSHILGNMAT